MTDDVVIELDGRRYRWTYDSQVASAADCWAWGDEQTYMTPPANIIARLNQTFIKTQASQVAGSIDDDHDFVRLHDVLRSMGARDEDFNADFLICCVEAADPSLFEELQFESLPPAGHTPFNCPVLRDWFLAPGPVQATLPKWLLCVGEGPFNLNEFLGFVVQRGVYPLTYPAPVPLASTPDALGAVALGRENWKAEHIDALIEEHRGRSLKIYSQEMFVAMLGCGRDPFAAGTEVLSAFRAGHPGLNFVSQGWPGWVETWVPFERSHRTSRSMPGQTWHQESPLHVMGYRVGQNGLPAYERRSILRAAFEEKLPDVGDNRYMAEWGQPKTPARLKKIANSLASNCRNQKKKERRSEQAIKDWQEDLDWLRDSYYQGHFAFQWPDTFV